MRGARITVRAPTSERVLVAQVCAGEATNRQQQLSSRPELIGRPRCGAAGVLRVLPAELFVADKIRVLNRGPINMDDPHLLSHVSTKT